MRGYFEGSVGPVEKVEIIHEPEAERLVAYVTFILPDDAVK